MGESNLNDIQGAVEACQLEINLVEEHFGLCPGQASANPGVADAEAVLDQEAGYGMFALLPDHHEKTLSAGAIATRRDHLADLDR